MRDLALPHHLRGVRGLVVGCFGLGLLLFSPTLASLNGVWLREWYSHGYLVAAAVVWLVWRERAVFQTPTEAVWWTNALTAMGSLLWLLASVTQIRALALGVFPWLLLAWTGAVYGREALRRLAPIAAVCLLGVPVWDILNPPLLGMTVAASGLLVDLLDIPAQIEGNLIRIAAGAFVVEGGCAGLNYLLGGLSIAAIYGQAWLSHLRSRVMLWTAAAVIAIIGNWVRVASLVAIGHATRMESGLVTEGHLWFGWVIFSIGLVILFPIVQRIDRWDRAMGPAGEESEQPPARTHVDARRTLVATAALSVGPLLYYAVGALPGRDAERATVEPDRATWAQLELDVPRPYEWEPVAPGASERVSTMWAGTDTVAVDHLLFTSQGEESELIGHPNRIALDGLVIVERMRGLMGAERLLVREAIVRDPGGPVLVWYWYRVGGVETASPVRAKLLEIPAFFLRSQLAELIALSTACAPDDCTAASATLRRFFAAG